MEDEFTSVRWDRESTIKNPSKQAHTPPRSPQQNPRSTPNIHGANSEVPKRNVSQGAAKKNVSQATSLANYSVSDDDASVFIASTVTSPQKESDGQNAYISYLVETRSNSPVFRSPRLRVRRRFSDFYFLYQCLANDYPACALPPLPDKQRLEYLKGDRFGHDFTSKRASSLNRFLLRMAAHPVLKRAKIYHVFLESSDWNSYKESLSVSRTGTLSDRAPDGAAGAGAAAWDTLGASSSVSESISDLFMNAFKHPQAQPNKEFVEINERCNKLNDNIVKIDKSFQKYVKRLGDLSAGFTTFSDLVVKLDQLESANPVPVLDPNAVQPQSGQAKKGNSASGSVSHQPQSVKPIAAVKDEASPNTQNSTLISDSRASSFVKFSKGLENLAFGLNRLRRYLDNDYLISLKDLENYIYSIKSLMKVKEQKQLDFEVLSEYLARAIHEKNQLLQQTGGYLPDNEAGPLSSSAGVPHSTTQVANNPNIHLPAPKPSALTSLASSTSNFFTSKLDDIKGINSTYQKKERLIKLSVKIETLEKEVVNAKKIFELFENEILHEVQYFDVIKSNELKTNLSSLTDNYIGFYRNLIGDWEGIEKSLEGDINEYNKKIAT